MNNFADDEKEDGRITGWGNSPTAFLVKIFVLSSLIAALAWWFVLS